jgi:hypothetical protein
MATGSVKSAAVVSIPLTLNYSGYSNISSISGDAFKSGNIVSLDLIINTTGGFYSDWATVGNISYPPINTLTVLIVQDSSNAQYAIRLNITNSGDIRLFFGQAGEYKCHLLYICNEN